MMASIGLGLDDGEQRPVLRLRRSIVRTHPEGGSQIGMGLQGLRAALPEGPTLDLEDLPVCGRGSLDGIAINDVSSWSGRRG